jgi:8-oxo-dGTP diphosphatase
LSAADTDFVGAKLLLVHGSEVLTYQRDDLPDLPWPGLWDLPGGGREQVETPEDCVLRELEEEFGLRLSADRLLWQRAFPSMRNPASIGWFFAGRIETPEIAAIRFGDEGQRWCMMPRAEWLSHPMGVAPLQTRSRIALRELGW